MIDVTFEMPCLTSYSTAEIYNEYKKNRIDKYQIIKPYIFNDCYMKRHSPIITYESSDYAAKYNNWTLYDKLQIQNNYIRYTFCEIIDQGSININGSILLGAIYSILIIINRVLKTLNKECKAEVNIEITSNQRMMFRMHKELMNIDALFTETYYLRECEKQQVNYKFSSIDNNEINKFTNRFLGLFSSTNPRSTNPFLAVTLGETQKFYNFLIYNGHYLVIDN